MRVKQPIFLKTKKVDIRTGHPWIALIHQKDALAYGFNAGDTISISWQRRETRVVINLTTSLVKEGQIGFVGDVFKEYHIKMGDLIRIRFVKRPASIEAICKKLSNKPLNYREIYQIIYDISEYRLTETEIAYFVASSFAYHFSNREIYFMTKAMAECGEMIKFRGKVLDKHSTGGLPGNRVTPIIVSIIAALGYRIPKTSSRAITSPAGTADTMEVLAPVTFDGKEIKQLVKKNNACLIWGGGIDLAPADDRIIRVSRPLSMEPYDKMLVSIIAKKVAMGIKYLIIDIPVGRTTKVPNLKIARQLAKKFYYLTEKFNIKTKVLMMPAKGPVGRGIGPTLEARDILRVLQQKANRPMDLEKKSVYEASQLLALANQGLKNKALKLCQQALVDGRAWKKMQQILKAQGGKANVDSEEIRQSKHIYAVKSSYSGIIKEIDNKALVSVCRTLGAPKSKIAGVYLNKIVGQRVKREETIFTLYGNTLNQLVLAEQALKGITIFKIKKIIVRKK